MFGGGHTCPRQIAWETGGQDWVDELKDDEYKMAKAKEAKPPPPPPAPVLPPKRKRSVKEAKILVYGLDGAGKSSIITKLASIADPPAPTHMFEVRRFNWQDVRLTVFDFGGAPPLPHSPFLFAPCHKTASF